MKKVIKTLISLATILTTLCACNNISNSESLEIKFQEVETVLNDRQIEILESYSLPTNYEELSNSEKLAIDSIEEMLVYVEEKYEKEFMFSSYDNGESSGEEKLYAYPSDGSKDYTTFKIVADRTGDEVVFTDDFMKILIQSTCEKYIYEQTSKYIQSDYVTVVSTIFYTTIEFSKENDYKTSDIPMNVSSSTIVFVDTGKVTRQEYQELAENLEINLNEAGFPYLEMQIIFSNEDVFEKINDYNYTDYLLGTYYSDRITFWIK